MTGPSPITTSPSNLERDTYKCEHLATKFVTARPRGSSYTGVRPSDKTGRYPDHCKEIMIRPLLRSTLLVLICSVISPAGIAARPMTLDDVLKQMDREQSEFHSLTASIERTKVTVIVNDRSTESGQIDIRRDGKMRIDLTSPDQ